MLDLRSNPNGRPEATFTLQLQQSHALKLGDIIKVSNRWGTGTTGWSLVRCQIRRIVTNLDLMEETLTVRYVHDLLA